MGVSCEYTGEDKCMNLQKLKENKNNKKKKENWHKINYCSNQISNYNNSSCTPFFHFRSISISISKLRFNLQNKKNGRRFSQGAKVRSGSVQVCSNALTQEVTHPNPNKAATQSVKDKLLAGIVADSKLTLLFCFFATLLHN